jgi:hypothetical protein
MSIYYYITKRSGPFVREGPDISETEWRAVVSADPDLSLEVPEPPTRLPRDAVWAAWRSYPGGYPAWFALNKGDVEVKGMDDALFGKFRQLALALEARIFCETGEELT